MSNEGKIKVPITDRNGKQTHVWKSPEEIKADAASASRASSVKSIPSAASLPQDSNDTKAWSGILDTSQNPFVNSKEWEHKIDLTDLSRPGLDLDIRADLIVNAIQQSSWFSESIAHGDTELKDSLDEIQEAADSGDNGRFDAVWNGIYNLADNDRVWLETI